MKSWSSLVPGKLFFGELDGYAQIYQSTEILVLVYWMKEGSLNPWSLSFARLPNWGNYLSGTYLDLFALTLHLGRNWNQLQTLATNTGTETVALREPYGSRWELYKVKWPRTGPKQAGHFSLLLRKHLTQPRVAKTATWRGSATDNGIQPPVHTLSTRSHSLRNLSPLCGTTGRTSEAGLTNMKIPKPLHFLCASWKLFSFSSVILSLILLFGSLCSLSWIITKGHEFSPTLQRTGVAPFKQQDRIKRPQSE